MAYKNKKNLTLACSAIAAITFAQPVFAKTKESTKNENSNICKKIYAYSDLNRKLNNPKVYRNQKERQKINDILRKVMVPFHSSEDTQSSIFEGLDIDGDEKDDAVSRSCGSGSGRLCSLFITFSSGGYDNDFEAGSFWLGRIGRDVYLVEEVIGDSSSYSYNDKATIYRVTKDSITSICRK